MNDIPEEIRKKIEDYAKEHGFVNAFRDKPTFQFQEGAEYGYSLAHGEIESLRKENEKLREALKPFDALAIEVINNPTLNINQNIYAYNKATISMKDLRLVHNLLTPKP